jgi:monoamine oxidase
MNEHSDVEGIGLGLVAPPSSTGIKVIVVGSGFAGLACAIECKRKGHDVLVLEKFSELKVLGELNHFDSRIIVNGELIVVR